MSYESTKNILRDKAQGWSLDYYKCKGTSYDVPLVRAEAMLELMKKEGELEILQKDLAAFVATVPKEPQGSSKQHIKQMESMVSQLKSEMSALSFTSYGADRPSSLSKAQDIYDIILYKKLLEKQRIMLLHSVRNLFMRNGNEEEMRQGVVMAESRFAAAMASLAPAAAAEPAPAPVPEPKKRSRAYSEDDGWDEEEW